MYYDYFDTNLIGELTLIADDRGLRHIVFESPRNPVQIQKTWQRKPAFFEETRRQLGAYFDGRLKAFDLPLAPRGTPFQQSVWQALQTIPYGRTASYGQVARQIRNPRAVRAVGGANARNPLPIVVPCHRVIGSNGTLTGFGGGLDVKEKLIALERGTVSGG